MSKGTRLAPSSSTRLAHSPPASSRWARLLHTWTSTGHCIHAHAPCTCMWLHTRTQACKCMCTTHDARARIAGERGALVDLGAASARANSHRCLCRVLIRALDRKGDCAPSHGADGGGEQRQRHASVRHMAHTQSCALFRCLATHPYPQPSPSPSTTHSTLAASPSPSTLNTQSSPT